MNLLNVWGALWGERKRRPDDDEDSADTDRSVSDYMEWFLRHMLQTSRVEVTLDSSKPLPDGAGTSKEPWSGVFPPVEAVLNRLKVVSGLDPVPFRKAMYGRFERSRGTLVFTYTTCFVDDTEGSRCRISVTIRVAAGK